MNNDLGNILPAPEIRICSLCNSEYTAYFEGSRICGKCLREKENKETSAKQKARGKKRISKGAQGEKRRERAKEVKPGKTIELVDNSEVNFKDDLNYDVLQEIEITPNRKCHDCHKKTYNFRCGECLKKWKIKNHVPLDDKYLDGIDE